ncbi:MAG: ATP-grasp domain-containing protein, partial [Planctomycetota bacterium]
MKSVAFLSTDSLEDFVCYDDLLIDPMADAGFRVERVPWRAPENWDRFDAVIVRSTWDYQDEPDAFLRTLRA